VKLDDLPSLSVYEPAFLADPHPVLSEIRKESSLAHSERGIELLSYSDCERALRDPAFAVGFDEMMAATGITDGPAHEAIVNSINNTEGELHVRLRRAIAPYLVPRRVNELRGTIRDSIERRLTEFSNVGECDLVEAVARWLPATAFCLLTGAPLEDRALIGRLSDQAQRFFEMQPLNRDLVEEGLAEVEAYMDALIEERRSASRDDVISHLISRERAGELSTEEVRNLSTILLAASTDTTSGQLTYTFVALAENPECYRRLRTAPDLVGNAVLETARFRPSLWTAPRFAREGGRLNGLELAPGTQLNAFFLAANRDPEVYEAPETFAIDRQLVRPPLNWSSGRHFCPGRPLAVMEIEEALRAATGIWESFELVEPVAPRGAPYIVAPTTAQVRFETVREA
jgi:cytochrome P450